MSPILVGAIGIVVLIVLLSMGMYIGFAMAVVGFLGYSYVTSFDAGFSILGIAPYRTASTYLWSVLPLFVLMGELSAVSGLSRDTYASAYKWIGNRPGGLAMATIIGCGCFAAVCGSSPATAATMGTIALPEMLKHKYDKKMATGVLAAGGTLGILIPPSVVFVVYGIITELSVGKLFLAGFLPGFLLTFSFIVTIYIITKRNPMSAPAGARTAFKDKLASLKGTWGIMALFLLIMGGLYVGIFTPTEAAAVGASGALVIALSIKQLTWKTFVTSLINTGRTTGMVFLILIGAMIFGYFLAVTRIPSELATFLAGLALPPYIVLILILCLFLILGCMMDAMAMIILVVPIIAPVIQALGFDLIWFGVIIVLVTEAALITPPVGLNVYVIRGVARDIPLGTIFLGIFPFLIAMIVVIALLIIFPEIALFLPTTMK